MFGGSVNQEVTSKAVKDRKPLLFSAQEHRGDIVGPASSSRGLNQLAALRLQAAVAGQL